MSQNFCIACFSHAHAFTRTNVDRHATFLVMHKCSALYLCKKKKKKKNQTQVYTEDMVTRTSLIYYFLLAFLCTGTHNLSVTFTHTATPASHHKHGDSGWSCVCVRASNLLLSVSSLESDCHYHTHRPQTHTLICLVEGPF